MLTLLGRSFRRAAWVFGALAAVLAVFQIVIVAVAATFETSRSFERLASFVPGFATRSMAGSLLTLASFPAMAVAGYFHPIVVLVVTQLAVYLASEPAGDVEAGIVDLVLARPVARHRLVTRSALVTAGATVLLTLILGVATAVGLTIFAPAGSRWPAAATVAVLSVELLLVGWCFGAVALAAAAFARRRANAILTVGIGAVALYLLEFLGASWDPAAPLAKLSPFHYYDGTAVLVGRSDVPLDVAVLCGVTAAALALAYWQFARRDL